MARRALVPLTSLLLLACFATGCAPFLAVPLVQRGIAAITLDPQPTDPSLSSAPSGSEYAHWLEPGHPLATGISTAEHGAVDLAGLVAESRKRDVIWIGVDEDNPQAYRLTAKYLRALARTGASPRLVVAAVPSEAQDQLQAPSRGTVRQRAWALSESLPWADYGAEDPVIMPGMMEPVFRAALDARYPLIAGGYSREKVRWVALEGQAARNSREASSIGLDMDWPQNRTHALRSALDQSSCERAPEALAESRVLVDRAESGGVAARVLGMVRKGVHPSVVVITELRHGRSDVGSPHALAALAARRKGAVKQLSIGVQEADWNRQNIAQYREELARHDAVWLTEPVYDDPEADPLAQCAQKIAQR